MIYAADFVNMAGKIQHTSVAKYLHDLGWIDIPTKRNNIKIFQFEKNRDFYQVDLPLSRELRDYSKAMYRVAENISQAVDKSVEEIILELLNPVADILKLRIQESHTETGNIFIEDAITLYDNAKKLVLATAKDIIRPQLSHGRVNERAIDDFIRGCRFGQTEIGSYIVSIVCPIGKLDDRQYRQLTLFDREDDLAESLTRQVVNKLITSVRRVRDAIDQGDLERFIYESIATKSCVSTNFLDALSKINIYRENSVLDIDLKYAPTIRGNRLDETFVSIDHNYYAPIDTFVKNFTAVQEDEKTFIGRIKKLSAVPDAKKRDSGVITLVFIDEEEKKISASVRLTKEDYDVAIEAHREGKTVKVVGTLSSEKNAKSIDCSYFEILG